MKERTSKATAQADRVREHPPAEHPAARDGMTGAAQDLHSVLLDSLVDFAVFALDASGHVLTWNTGARRLKGYTAEEVIGQHFSLFFPPEDVAAGKPERELRDAEQRGSVENEGWRVRKDGTRFWANVIITPMRSATGELIGFAKATRDLTQHRTAEIALRASEERFRLLVHSVKDYAIFMLDPDGRVATWNEGAQRIKGYSADEIIGRSFSLFYTEDAVASRYPQWELQVAAREGRFEDEGWRVRKDGSLFWANVVITALRNERGELVGFAKVTRDLTERQKAQQRAIADARRVAEMETANRTKMEFLSAVSHELRTPLNAIGGYTDLLSMGVPGPLNERQKQYVDRIRSGQQILLALVNDLLNYTRVEAGGLEYDLGPVRMRGMLEELTAMLQPQADAKQITLKASACSGEPIAWADAARVQQILLNLLTNALKFTPPRGRVELACSASDDRISVSVADTGPGIPEEALDSIFEPFVQVGRSLTTSHDGVGLGLAISRQLARAMDGELSVTSSVGVGSTFTLTLPQAGTSQMASGS